MKKLTLIALVTLGLTACKKENSTSTTTEKDSLAQVQNPGDSLSSPALEKALAIEEKNGVYTQSFQLVKGATYPLTTFQRSIQKLTGPDGKSQTATSQSTDVMNFSVEDFKDGVYDIKIHLEGKSSSQTAGGKTVGVDTKGKAPSDPQLKMMWNINKALTGNTLAMKMKSTGEVISIAGFDPIYDKISTVAAKEIKDAEQRKGFLASFKDSFNEEAIKTQFSTNLMVLPKEGAKIGQQWSETENASPDGKVKLTTRYTLESVKDGLVTIKVAGGIPKKSDERTNEGVTHKVSSELSQSGTVTLDQKTGWIKNQNVSVKTTQNESLSDGKQSESMKSEATTTVIVNPEK